jgi:hypothetical protein
MYARPAMRSVRPGPALTFQAYPVDGFDGRRTTSRSPGRSIRCDPFAAGPTVTLSDIEASRLDAGVTGRTSPNKGTHHEQ